MTGDRIQKENHAWRVASHSAPPPSLPKQGERPRPVVGRRAALLLSLGFGFFAGSVPPASAQTVSSLVWQFLGPPALTVRVAGLAVDPRNDATVYLAAPGGGIWRSDDRGQTWFQQFDSSTTLPVCTLTLDALSPDVLYAGTGDNQSPRPSQGVARTANGGQNWTFQQRFTNRPVCALTIDPNDSRHLMAGSSEGAFVSFDTGTTWRKTLSFPVTSFAFDGQGSLYAGILGTNSSFLRDSLLARSNDGGRTWAILPLPANTDSPNSPTNWVSVVALGPSLSVMIAYQDFQTSKFLLDFYRSPDSGSNWTLFPAIGTGRHPVKLLYDPLTQYLYSLGASLQVSINQGTTWSIIPTTVGPLNDAAFMGRSPLTGGAVPTAGSLLVAGEKGLQLVPLIAGAPAGILPLPPISQFLDVTMDSAQNIWAAGPSGLFALPPAPATTWRAVLPGVAVGAVQAVSGFSMQTGLVTEDVYASANAAIYHSADGGTTFSATTVIPAEELRAPFPPMAFDPTEAQIAFLGGRRLYRTSDAGVTWTALPSMIDPDPTHVIVAAAIAPAARRFMYVATACLPEAVASTVTCSSTTLLWRSQNTGQSWARVAAVPGLVSRLAVDPRQNNTVYAAVGAFPGGPSSTAGLSPGDLLRSTDGGVSFASLRNNLPPVPINTIVIDPTSFGNSTTQPTQTIYIGTDAGVFVTFNAGSQWIAMSSGLPPSPVTELSLRQPGATLLAATFGRGVYQASAAGLSTSLVINPSAVSVTAIVGGSSTGGFSLLNASQRTINWTLTALDPWLTAITAAGTLEARASAQVSFGVSAAGLQPGTYGGRLQVSIGSFAQNVFVTIQVTATPARLAIASGDNATGLIGTALPPLVVSVTGSDFAPLPGVQVSFSIASGGGTLSTRVSSTDAAGRTSTILTLPNTGGPVQVVASLGGISVTFNATALAVTRPVLLSGAVVNGATFTIGASVAPGSIVSIFGQNLAESSALASGLPLPTLLVSTRVLLSTASGAVALPLFFVSPGQVNAQLPPDLSSGVYLLSVEVASVGGVAIEVPVAATAPGIFTMNGDGRGQGVFVQPDGSLVSATNPAARGSVITLYATGLGPVSPPVEAGSPGAADEPLNRTVLTPQVFFDIFQAEVLYSGLAPGFVGVYQVNVLVPARLSPATNIPVSLAVSGVAGNRVTIPVR